MQDEEKTIPEKPETQVITEDQVTPEPQTTSVPQAEPDAQTISQEPPADTEEKEKLVKEFPKSEKKSFIKTILMVLLIIIAGVTSGYFLSSKGGTTGSIKSSESVEQEGIKVGDTLGIPDKETFRDEVEGVIVKGGVDGEGSHHLMRPGGASQNVYITSSVVDLDLFVDHRVKIWGETFSAQKAGWLMDVGRVEVLELNAEKPFKE